MIQNLLRFARLVHGLGGGPVGGARLNHAVDFDPLGWCCQVLNA